MKCLLAWRLLLLTACTIASDIDAKPLRGPVLDYEVRRFASDRYQVTMRFRGDHSGRTRLRLPSTWGDAKHAERGLEALGVLTRGARLEDVDDSVDKVVVHRADEALIVRYRLKQITRGEQEATNYLPVIQPEYFQWIGATAWIMPAADDASMRIRMHFAGLPAHWAFASSFGDVRGAVVYEGTLRRFGDSLFVGGDFRLQSRKVEGGRVVTAIRGTWPFTDVEFADRVASIVDAERAFWLDRHQGAFLVLLTKVQSPQRKRVFDGTALTGSFALFLSNVDALGDLDFMLTHEYFHTWNPRGIGTLRSFGSPAMGYWFSEGFTEFYSHLLRLRAGTLTLDKFASEFDAVLRSLAAMKERELPNAAIDPRFFTEPFTVGKLPYWRGMLLAAKWNGEIRATSQNRRSLDDAMRRLRMQYLAGDHALTSERITNVMRDEGVQDAGGDFERYIEQGQTLRLADDALGDCIRIDDAARSVFGDAIDSPIATAGEPIRQHVAVREGLDATQRSTCLADFGVTAH